MDMSRHIAEKPLDWHIHPYQAGALGDLPQLQALPKVKLKPSTFSSSSEIANMVSSVWAGK